ncbi:sterol-binding protein [Burkholderia glumae]|uniref:ubiquinone anaerobic biosynthesis accessory factor UbiT n=1 Tax=Burkholderia glumae TaxID=337 RepID=UPI0003A22DB9|nr:SCP2 sterol-binding domain-containing protein [Burkholderia glumae]MCM2495095.1 SCP2 sterol-binding domain-containing protein [Burkholderia glumae]MCM2545958.1 SCP2 sterol-binding domain-containing protein [Burkholderia glumae]MCQ0032955.1 SCP2 sterol-binding domain-containing protein [Burkholderia glumae]MCQ0036838.1 SCP2 sterol-binding domain-containing protein [Burkholderia glumae]PJO21842.1 sterol-binding protein [Burkholderia glumae AU6208]
MTRFAEAFLLPPLRRGLALLPVRPPATVLCLLLDRHLLPQLDDEARTRIAGRRYVIEVTDLGIAIGLTLGDDGFRVASDIPGTASATGRAANPAAGTAPAIRIAAGSGDFIRLAAREVDADTLFFNRRLVIQGETELALIVRNAIDAIDFSATRSGTVLHDLLRRVARRLAPPPRP